MRDNDVIEFLNCYFPRLSEGYFKLTSPKTSEYNCVAWAASDKERWWWPDAMNIYYWPPEVPRKEEIHSFVEAFRLLGYEMCSSGEREAGFEKIAIHINQEGIPAHLSRQLRSGNWTSKLGHLEDIEHDREGVCCLDYGEIGVFMKRHWSHGTL